VIVFIAANPAIDRLLAVDRVAPGAVHRPHAVVAVPGGKALNAARAAAALGADVHAVALVGGHAGRWVADGLAEAGVPLDAVWRAGETRSAVSVASPDEGLTEFYEPGPPVAPGDWERLVAAAAARCGDARWAVVSGSLPPGAPRDGYARLVGLAPTALDSIDSGLDAGPSVVKVNEAEAQALTRIRGETPDAALAQARAIQARTGAAAVVTRGRDGAVAVQVDGVALAGSSGGGGPYTVGSGDAFLGGLVAALDRGAAWPDALALALGAGAANAEVPGAGCLDTARARELAATANVTLLGR
jgi:1-phosphofructokinase family hexose kinase